MGADHGSLSVGFLVATAYDASKDDSVTFQNKLIANGLVVGIDFKIEYQPAAPMAAMYHDSGALSR